MFLDFYGLREQPFGITPDPAYLYLSATHREALAALLYGIKADRGFVALIAESGMGKTTLLYRLMEELHDSGRELFLSHQKCAARDFFFDPRGELGVNPLGGGLAEAQKKLNEV